MKSENKPVDEDRLVGLIVSHSKIRLLVLPDKLKSETALEGGDDNEVVFTEKLAGSAAKELPSAKCDSSNSPKFALLTIHATVQTRNYATKNNASYITSSEGDKIVELLSLSTI